jgi:hypothetical protein
MLLLLSWSAALSAYGGGYVNEKDLGFLCDLWLTGM